MVINPHVSCAKVLDTLKYSGLTYTLNETPYSVYLTVRKKYTKEYSPNQHINEHDTVNCYKYSFQHQSIFQYLIVNGK